VTADLLLLVLPSNESSVAVSADGFCETFGLFWVFCGLFELLG